ncbi:MAG: hypothetical protein Kow0037_17340 [Calditrichia bacterium]
MSEIRGLVLESRVEYVETRHGRNVWVNIVKSLPEPIGQAVGEQVFISNLYPFYLLKELDNAIGEVIQEPLEKLFKEIGAFHAGKIMDRYFFNYLDKRNPAGMLRQIKNLYGTLWNIGTCEVEENDSKNFTLSFHYKEDIYKSYCWFMQGFLSTSVEMCGGKAVRLSEGKCGAMDEDVCEYHLQWK